MQRGFKKKVTTEEVAFLCGTVDSYRTIVEEIRKVADTFERIHTLSKCIIL